MYVQLCPVVFSRRYAYAHMTQQITLLLIS